MSSLKEAAQQFDAALPRADDAWLAAVQQEFQLSPMGVEALYYVTAVHWDVFPLDGKVPFGKSRGFKDAKRDEDAVVHWWRKHPDANIGLPTGRINNIVVVDVDGPDGAAYLRKLVGDPVTVELGPEQGTVVVDPLDTFTVSSRPGRAHYYFKYPPAAHIGRKIKLAKVGLDILGDGGYVVAAPSVHPETHQPYAIVRGRPDMVLPVLPAGIIAALEEAHTERRVKQSGFRLPDVIPEGERDDTLFRYGSWLRGVTGLEEGDIADRLLEANAERCQPPLDEATVLAKAKQAALFPVGEKMDDIANAERLVQDYGENLRYVKAHKAWYVWDGRRWERDDRDHVMECAKKVARSFFADAVEQKADHVRKAIIGHATRSAARGRIEAMVALARSDKRVALKGSEFDADGWLLNVRNGTLDLRTGTLRPHARGDLLTKLAGVSFVAGALAPQWTAFLARIMADDPALLGYLQRAVGYALTGDTREECVFFCFGTGANGKTKFLEALRALLGDYAMDTNFTTFLDKQRGAGAASPDLARLRGARFVTAVEAPAGHAFNEALLKKMVGGDMLVARQLYQEEQEFAPQFKLFFAANHKPEVREQTEAFWRRMRLVPFAVTIPTDQRDKRLLDKLKAELPGILNWALAGCATWQRDGLREPAVIQGATDDYQEENDVIGEFLAACCTLNPGAWTATGDLYRAYTALQERTYGKDARPLGAKVFGRLLAQRSELEAAKRSNVRGWAGVALKPSSGDLGQDEPPQQDDGLPF